MKLEINKSFFPLYFLFALVLSVTFYPFIDDDFFFFELLQNPPVNEVEDLVSVINELVNHCI